jgi:hypothetical protein
MHFGFRGIQNKLQILPIMLNDVLAFSKVKLLALENSVIRINMLSCLNMSPNVVDIYNQKQGT